MNRRTPDLTSLVSFLCGGLVGVVVAQFVATEAGGAVKRLARRLRNAADPAREAGHRGIEDSAFAI